MKKLLLLILALAACAFAAKWTATTPGYTDVLSAYNSASDGDVIVIPTGSATWTGQTITVTKGKR